MTALSPNCLLEGETLAELVRRNCAIGFDLRFCRTVAHTPEDGETTPCDPTDAEFATLYARAAFWADAARAEAATLRRHIATLEAASAA